jgi:Pyroglutamyl peptidase
MRVVLAGFGPFPGMPFNPSAALVKALARRRRPAFADVVISTHVFATRYAAVDQDLAELAAQKPDLVLMFGVARRRRYLGIETRARNAQSVLYPDASGHRPARATIARYAARRRFRASWAQCDRAASRRACRAMPDVICVIMPIGARSKARGRRRRSFNSSTFRRSDRRRAAAARGAALLGFPGLLRPPKCCWSH